MEIHAHAVQTILSESYLVVLPRRLQYLWTLLLGLVAVTLALRVRGLLGALVTLLLAGGAVYAGW